MEFSLGATLNFLGSLGLFLVGMKVMSDSLMHLAGNKMRRILASMTANRYLAALTGLFITGLIQSSSATTLMVVSFVNAGLLNLVEALGVIMGANIGTTLTAWLIAVLGFKVSMIDIALPLMIAGFIFFIRDDKKSRDIGGFIIGFALLFIGLEFMKNAVPDLQNNPEVFELIQKMNGYGFWSLLLFAGLGTILTLVLQSSSATMAITLIAVSQGWLPFEAGCAIVLGENIGTTITANMAALVSSINARRAALAHLVFNIIGVTWVLILFDPFIYLVTWLTEAITGASPLTNPDDAPIGLAIFHSVFNIVNTGIMIGFIGPLAVLVTRLLPDRPEPEVEKVGAIYLDDKALKYPQTAIHAALKETRRLYREPLYEALLQGINVKPEGVVEGADIPALVAASREVLTPDIEDVALNRIRPICSDLADFGIKVNQRFDLEDEESRQLRNIGFAARDSLSILGDVNQLNREFNRYMNDDNEDARACFDDQRATLLQFLMGTEVLDLGLSKEELEAELKAAWEAAEQREVQAIEQVNQLLESDRISAESAASLYTVAGLVRSLSHELIRAVRLVSDASASYSEVEAEADPIPA